mmetsp:Transcript_5800/g.16271  ORF Transcript_5800/g.16271 Transcript_5800/m.16271 type:complete len:135 (-) Transcript_5800:3113-3517(-)
MGVVFLRKSALRSFAKIMTFPTDHKLKPEPSFLFFEKKRMTKRSHQENKTIKDRFLTSHRNHNGHRLQSYSTLTIFFASPVSYQSTVVRKAAAVATVAAASQLQKKKNLETRNNGNRSSCTQTRYDAGTQFCQA